jgi:hypothetical protein
LLETKLNCAKYLTVSETRRLSLTIYGQEREMLLIRIHLKIFLGQFFHVTAIMDDFGKPCFIHGATDAFTAAILIIGTLIYIVLR